MTYVASPADSTRPLDSDDASGGAAELRALKGYLQTLIAGATIPANGYAWRGFRNKLINGKFDFWQRGTSLAAAAQTTYLADRWSNGSTGSSIAPSQQAFAVGQGVVPNEPTYFHRVVVTSVVGANNYSTMYQKIEGARTLAGQVATLSFWAKADAVKNIAVEFTQSFGTGGTPSADVNSIGVTTIGLTTAWKFYTVQVNIPSIAGKVFGTSGTDYLSVGFWWEAGSAYAARSNSLGNQSGTFDIANIQFEEGTSASPFEMRPAQVELGLCMRYYELLPMTTTPSIPAYTYFWYKSTKRGTPTLSVFAGSLSTGASLGVGPVPTAAFRLETPATSGTADQTIASNAEL